MAKKAPAKKGKVKKTKAAKAKAPEAVVVPTYLDKDASFKMGLHDVIRALKVIEKHGHLTKFVNQLKKSSKPMIVPAETVNFVKDFMVENKMHKDPVGRHIVNAKVAQPPPGAELSMGPAGAARDRFGGCNFGSGG